MIDWTEIVRQHGNVVWQTAYRLLGNEADASDCFQKTFLEALRVARREPVGDWAALLSRVAVARALDALRTRYREKGRNESSVDVAALVDTESDPSQRAEATELAERLRVAVGELPRQQAEVFCLCCLDGMTYHDVAKRLRLDTGKVGVLLHRARKRLRQRLASVDPKSPSSC